MSEGTTPNPFNEFIDGLVKGPGYSGQVAHIHRVPERNARYGEPSVPLCSHARQALAGQGINRLYTHQAQSLDAWRRGANPLVVTGTASGKSLCYLMPLVETLANDPNATALLLFPSKALAQDQSLRLRELLDSAGLDGVLAGVFDGDTPAMSRRRLRDHGNVILTNPDMLHAGLLPQHPRWTRFLSNLRLVVVDELHVYSGILGSNAVHLFHRFDRVLRHYGASPGWIACSATIGNPLGLAETVIGKPFETVDDDGSPMGERLYVLWNPPIVRNTRYRSRRSANVEAHELMADLMVAGVRTITFSKAKMVAEMMQRYVTEALRERAPHLAGKIETYRGGYLPGDRRAIEARLFNGELLGVSSTRALELGIDVGGLDASILIGYPGTLASFIQQTGRAGRGGRPALCILVGLDTAINQYIMNHPEYLFGRPIESAVLDPGNPFVILGHIRCAAHERPICDDELGDFGAKAREAAEILLGNHKLAHINGTWYHASAETPQHEVHLRDYSEANVAITDADTGEVIGQLDKLDAPPILHPEAIYMHHGDTYRVLELDLPRRLCYVKRVETDYYTQPIGGTDVHHIDHTLRSKDFGTGKAYWGEVTSKFHLWGYEKIRFYELDAISVHKAEVPESYLETMAFWIVPPEPLMQEVIRAGLDPHSGLKGLGFATRMILPLFMTCDTLDFSHTVGAVNAPWNALFIYERYLWGLGFTEKAYNLLHHVMPRVLQAVGECPCADGCPCCVGKPLRQEVTWNVERGEAVIPSKAATLIILRGLLGDGANLENADDSSLQDSEADEGLKTERALRRRLERMREPRAVHPIDPVVPVAYPAPEPERVLDTPDQEARADRKQELHRELRKRLRQVEVGRGNAKSRLDKARDLDITIEHPVPPAAPVFDPGTPLPGDSSRSALGDAPVALGDSLAAKARRRKKEGKP